MTNSPRPPLSFAAELEGALPTVANAHCATLALPGYRAGPPLAPGADAVPLAVCGAPLTCSLTSTPSPKFGAPRSSLSSAHDVSEPPVGAPHLASGRCQSRSARKCASAVTCVVTFRASVTLGVPLWAPQECARADSLERGVCVGVRRGSPAPGTPALLPAQKRVTYFLPSRPGLPPKHFPSLHESPPSWG